MPGSAFLRPLARNKFTVGVALLQLLLQNPLVGSAHPGFAVRRHIGIILTLLIAEQIAHFLVQAPHRRVGLLDTDFTTRKLTPGQDILAEAEQLRSQAQPLKRLHHSKRPKSRRMRLRESYP